MRILAVTDDADHSIAHIRLRTPLGALAELGTCTLRVRSLWACSRLDWQWADVVVMQRPVGKKSRRVFDWLRARHIPVVYDIDDLLFEPADHLQDSAWLRAQAINVKSMLGSASAVSVSTLELLRRIAPLNERAMHVPNHAPASPPPAAHHLTGQRPTLVIAASDYQQVHHLVLAVQSLVTEGLAFDLVSIGPIADSLASLGLPTKKLPLMSHSEFLTTVSRLPSPVGAMPLDGSQFSQCKSAVKYFDYASVGVVCVCANRLPYSDAVVHDKTGLLCDDNPESWKNQLRRVLRSAELRLSLAIAAREDVRVRHTLERSAAAWNQVLQLAVSREADQPRRGMVMRALDTWIAQLERLRISLRALNRRRLEKSRRRRN